VSRPRNPQALRRGPKFILAIPAEELEAAQADAAKRGLSLAGHVRDVLKRWRKNGRMRG